MGEFITVCRVSIFAAKRGHKRLKAGWHGKIDPHLSNCYAAACAVYSTLGDSAALLTAVGNPPYEPEHMSSNDSLGFLLEWLPHPGPRFEALEAPLHAIEESIAHQSDQRALRAQAELRKRGIAPDEASNELAVLHHETEQLLSRLLRSGLLISMWSLFESGIRNLAQHVGEKQKLDFEFKVPRGKDLLTAADEFFQRTVNIAPFPNLEDRRRLDLLRRLRNGFSHADGSFSDVPKELVHNGYVHGFCLIGDSHEFAVPSAEYVRSSLELLRRVSQSLADNVFGRTSSENGAA